MARIIKSSGNGPLYTGDSFSTVEDRNRERVTSKSSIQKLVEAIKLADMIGSSPAVGIAADLVKKGAGAIGGAIEEAGMVSEAREDIAKKELEKGVEVESLRKQAELKLDEAETPTAIADDAQKDIDFVKKKNLYLKDLKDKASRLSRESRTDLYKSIGQGIKDGYITEEEGIKAKEQIDKKLMTPIKPEEKDSVVREIADLEYEASGERVKMGMLEDSGVTTGIEYDTAKNRYQFLKNKADEKRRQLEDFDKSGEPISTPEEVDDVKAIDSIVRKIREEDKVDQAILALRQRARSGKLSPQQEKVLKTLEAEEAGGVALESMGRESAIKKKGVLSNVKDKSQAQLKKEMGKLYGESDTMAVEDESEGMVMAPDSEPKNLLDEAEAERKRKLTDEANRLSEDATLLAETPIRKSGSVTFDEKGMPTVERKPVYSEEDLLEMARKADTLEKQSQVIGLVEDADVAAKSLFDMVSGQHKVRFAEQVKKFFPALPKKSQAVLDAEMELIRARAAKLREETGVVRPKAEADIDLKRARTGTEAQREIDLDKKNKANVKGYDFWEATIFSKIRPRAKSGGSGIAAARLYISEVERAGARAKEEIIKAVEPKIKSLEESYSRKQNELTRLGPDQEALPSKPKLLTPKNKAEWEKETREAAQRNAKRKQLSESAAKEKEQADRLSAERDGNLRGLNEAIDKKIKSVTGGVDVSIPRAPKKEEKTPSSF